VSLATGAKGGFTLYEDDGRTPDLNQSATTALAYEESAGGHTLTIQPAQGGFVGQVASRSWNVVFMNADAPASVRLDGKVLAPGQWTYDPSARRLTVPVAQRSVHTRTVVAYR